MAQAADERRRDVSNRGVRTYDEKKAFYGYTLYCHTYEDPSSSASGTGHIYLIDLDLWPGSAPGALLAPYRSGPRTAVPQQQQRPQRRR